MAFIPALAAGAASAAGGVSGLLGLGATLVSAVGAYQQGQASAAAAEYNAKLAEMQGKVAQDQAASRATELKQRTRRRVSQAATSVLESGFTLGGSFKDWIDQTIKFGEYDALSEIYEGEVAATGARNSAQLSRYEAKNYKRAGLIGAGSKLLGGVSSFAKNKGGSSIAPWQTSIVPSSTF